MCEANESVPNCCQKHKHLAIIWTGSDEAEKSWSDAVLWLTKCSFIQRSATTLPFRNRLSVHFTIFSFCLYRTKDFISMENDIPSILKFRLSHQSAFETQALISICLVYWYQEAFCFWVHFLPWMFIAILKTSVYCKAKITNVTN